jgi:hypothetical protein
MEPRECKHSATAGSKESAGDRLLETVTSISSILFDMTDSSKLELPDSYLLTILEINGVPVEKLSRPLEPTETDSIYIRIEPVHINPAITRAEYLYVTLQELREMQRPNQGKQLILLAELSGEPGVSAGEVKFARQWIERILRDQENRRGERPDA